MAKKFLTSVADVYAYDAEDNIVFTSKTLLDSSIEVTLGSTPVRGGQGNQLQYTYYHTAEMNINLTDTQWNLGMLAATVGSNLDLGNYYKQETVTIAAGTGTVSETPIAFDGVTIYGWATSPLGITQKVTISEAGEFTVTGEELSGDFCVRYYTENKSKGMSFTIASNFMPKIVKLVLETQLNSADSTTNKIGIVQIIVPKAMLSGAFSISMTADGISNTPLTAQALSYTPSSSDSDDACASSTGYYAKVVEIIDNSNWWDDVYAISIYGGDFDMEVGETTTLVVYGINDSGLSFRVPNEDLTFASNTSAVATIGATSGSVTALTGGSTTLSAFITSASTIDDDAVLTVSA